MPTTRPFAYYTGSPISGTEQLGSLAIGTPDIGFNPTTFETFYGRYVQWWNGPDEELGYVICKPIPLDNQPTSVPGDNLFLSTTYKAIDISLSNNNQTATQIFSYQQSVLGETLISSTEKVMFSVKFTSTNPSVGVGGRFIGMGATSMNYQGNPFGGYPGNDNHSTGFSDDGKLYYNGQIQWSGLPTWTSGDIIDIAVDGVSQQWWIRVNGGYWCNDDQADPITNIGGFDMTIGDSYPVLCPYIYGKMEILNLPKYGSMLLDNGFHLSGYKFLGKTTASVGFLRSTDLTEISFVNLVNSKFSQNFSTGMDSKNWLNNNGYWTSWLNGSFISTWRTTDPGESITLPYVIGGSYDGTIDWGDGNVTTNSYSDRTHIYDNPGDYIVTVTGTINGFEFGYTEDFINSGKIISVQQWGTLQISNNGYQFYGCFNLDLSLVSDVLSLYNITNLNSAFKLNLTITSINNSNLWDVSSVTDMSSMFSDCNTFNSDISSWDVSSVITMSGMFMSTLFNQDISSWNILGVTDMSEMFSGSTFNQNIGSWDVSGVTDMSGMFSGSTFNQNIGSWDVSGVTNMSSMFSSSTFNQNIGSWDVSGVTDMSMMFASIIDFNQDISSWNVSSVTNMAGMFSGSGINGYISPFNQNIGSWDVSSVTNMSSMFQYNNTFNQNINSWNVSSVTNMSYMFYGSTFNQNISSWDVSSVTNMSYMFCASTFNQNINSWNLLSAEDLSWMFYSNLYFNQNISSWNVSNVTNMSGMFYYSVFNQNIGSWNVSNVTNMTSMFGRSYFNQNISSWNVSNVTSMIGMFYQSTFNQNIGSWNVSSVTSMNGMFRENVYFNQDLSGWCVSLITSLPNLFYTEVAWTLPKPVWGTCPP